MKQLNKNIIYNIIYQVFIYIIPLISVPYVSRVLGVNNIGIYSYTYSMVYYFMLFAMLGINNYGSRSIAKCSEKKSLSNTFWEIYYLQFILTFIMLVAYILFILFVFKDYQIISCIQIINLISVFLDINWFYFGIENFKLTISRNIVVKSFSLMMIFLLVKSNSDLWIYTLIMAISTFVSQAYLWIMLKKYIFFDVPRKKIVKKSFSHLKHVLVLFIPVIAYSIYRVMDKTMIGNIASTVELGYYENAEKIVNIPVSFLTALGTVMIPYMSKRANNNSQFINKINYAFELCFILIIPMFFGLLTIGEDFSVVFFGNEFLKSGRLIQLLSVTIIFIAIANIIRTSYLIPKEKDSIYVKSTVLGAICNIILNLIFIPLYGATGACIGTIVAEFCVWLYQFVSVKKELFDKNVDIYKMFIQYMIKGLVMFFIIYLFKFIVFDIYLRLFLQITTAIVIWIIFNYNNVKNKFFK